MDVPDLEAQKEQDTDPEGSVRNPRIRIRTKIQHCKDDVEGEPTTTP
jgi:hypothetical protein